MDIKNTFYTDEDIKRVDELIRTSYANDLKIVQSLARNEGLIAGHKNGLEEGISKGREAGYEEGYEIGLKNGIKKKSIQVAKSLLSQNISTYVISKSTGLSLKTIKDLNS